MPFDTPWAEIAKRAPEGRSSSRAAPPASTTTARREPDPAIWTAGVPVLGICYGLQLMAHQLGGEVVPPTRHEYGPARVTFSDATPNGLFAGLEREQPVWMSHGDSIVRPPAGFRPTAQTDSTPYAGLADTERGLYGIQFHPEVVHTPRGRDILRNFVVGVAGARQTWTAANFIESTVNEIRSRVDAHARATGSTGLVICALSGGVDSAVAAALVHRAVGDRLTCIYVDHGLMRKRESELLRVDVRAEPRHEPRDGRRARAVPRPSRRRRGPGAEAEDHRRRVHPRLRGGGGAPRRRQPDRLPDPGHALPRRDRVGDVRFEGRRTRSRATTTSAGCRRTCGSR